MILTVGFDEAGRGPLAGPVCASAVILPPVFPIEILNDSKKLSEKKRLAAEKIIKEKACWGISLIDHKTIDQINILEASMLAMHNAFEEMIVKLPEWCKKLGLSSDYSLTGITDGTRCPQVPVECRCEAKADGKYPCVMAASILAKEARDAVMLKYDAMYPEYGYAGHKGYPTKKHREVCKRLGPSPIQRLTFNYR